MVLIECRFFPSRNEYNYYHQKLLHPYTIGVIVAGTSFLLVFRLQAAYNRYWEAATNVYHMMSKWMDAGTCFRRVAGFSRGLCRFAFASGSSYFRFDLTISLASLSLSLDRDFSIGAVLYLFRTAMRLSLFCVSVPS